MAITGEDNIVLKLGIKGVDPAEARAIALQGSSGLEAAFKESLARQEELYKAAAGSMNAEARAAAQAELATHQSKATAIQSLLKQAYAEEEAAAAEHAKKMQETSLAGRATALGEGLEATKASAMGTLGAAFFGYEAIKGIGEFAESMAHVAAVTDAFTGSISDLREATDGEISDMDLMTASNLAAAKSLSLSSDQFGIVSKAALRFAEATGGNVKEALDEMISGLATGRSRGLQMAGVILDQEAIFADYAKAIGHAGETLDQHAKSVALSQAAMEALDLKTIELGVHAEGFGEKMHWLGAQIGNVWTDILGFFAKGGTYIIKLFELDIPNSFRQSIAAWKDLLPGQHGNEDAAMKVNAEKTAEWQKAQLEKSQKDVDSAMSRVASAGAAYAPEKGGKGGVQRDTNPTTKFDFMSNLKLADMAQDEYGVSGPDGLPRGDADWISEQAAKRAKAIGDFWNKSLQEKFGDQSQYSDAELSTIYSGASKTKSDVVLNMLKGAGWSDEDIAKAATDTADTVVHDLDDKLKAAMDKMDKQTKANKQKAGPLTSNIMEQFFGPDIMDTARDKMTQLQGIVYDASQTMSNDFESAGDKMASGFGKAVSATLIHGTSLTAGLRNETEAVLESLSSQALGQSLMYAAKALAWGAEALFTGDAHAAAAAAEAGAAAVAFGAVGLAAAGAARAVGTSSTSPGGTPTTTGSQPGFGGPTTSSSSGGQGGTVILQVSVMPGGESAAGDSIVKAIAAYQAQTGQTLDQMLRN
jgi:hypothetical protein